MEFLEGAAFLVEQGYQAATDGAWIAPAGERLTFEEALKREHAIDGFDDSPDNPLARALRDLLQSGAPTPHRLDVFFADPFTGALRWFGVFVQTIGNQVVFFPGISTMPNRTAGQHGDRRAAFDRRMTVDHLTLEADRRKWHLTATNKIDRQRAGETQSINGGAVVWFGMSVANPGVLRLFKATRIAAEVPASDAARRKGAIAAMTKGKTFALLQLPGTSPYGPTAAVHFCVIVGPPTAPEYDGDYMAFSAESPYVARRLPLTGEYAPRLHFSFALSPQVQIQIVATWIPVELREPESFTYGSNGGEC